MFKLILILFIFSFNLVVLGRELPDFDRFWVVLTKLESSNNPKAIGDGGKAIGIAQIHKIYFIDAQKNNEFLQKYSYSNCFDAEISKLVVKAYIVRYSKTDDFQEWARIHNGGPLGNKKQSTIKYWLKFKKMLAAGK